VPGGQSGGPWLAKEATPRIVSVGAQIVA
jgi:hypothetical protein